LQGRAGVGLGRGRLVPCPDFGRVQQTQIGL
jgi:hypothetical protein